MSQKIIETGPKVSNTKCTPQKQAREGSDAFKGSMMQEKLHSRDGPDSTSAK